MKRTRVFLSIYILVSDWAEEVVVLRDPQSDHKELACGLGMS